MAIENRPKLFPVSEHATQRAVTAFTEGKIVRSEGLNGAITVASIRRQPEIGSREGLRFDPHGFDEGFVLFHTATKIHAEDIHIPFPEIVQVDSAAVIMRDARLGSDNPDLVTKMQTYIANIAEGKTLEQGLTLEEKLKEVKKIAEDPDTEMRTLIFHPDAEDKRATLSEFPKAVKKGANKRAVAFVNGELPFLTTVSNTIWAEEGNQFRVSRLAGAIDAKEAIRVALRRLQG